jgi:hypothetical protein
MVYFKHIVQGKKLAIHKDDYREINVAKYPELTIEFALAQAKEDEEVMAYIPDHWLRPKAKIDRNFLWGILHSKQTDYINQIVVNANKKRMQTASLEKEELQVQVCQEVALMIANIPY